MVCISPADLAASSTERMEAAASPQLQQVQLQESSTPVELETQQLPLSAVTAAASLEDKDSRTPDARHGSDMVSQEGVHAHVLQLLPGLSPACVPAVAARMLDASKVSLGKKLGCGAFATVYQAQLQGSRGTWVVKRLDRAGRDHLQQVRKGAVLLNNRKKKR